MFGGFERLFIVLCKEPMIGLRTLTKHLKAMDITNHELTLRFVQEYMLISSY